MKSNKKRVLKSWPMWIIYDVQNKRLIYKKETINTLVKFFNRKLNMNLACRDFGYTKNICGKIDLLYKLFKSEWFSSVKYGKV